MEAIKRKKKILRLLQILKLFRKHIFFYFAKIDIYVFSSMIMHNALLRQVIHDELM